MESITRLPMVRPNGEPDDQEEPKTFLVRQMKPAYCATTSSPLATFAPLPLTSVLVTRALGGVADGNVTVGAVPDLALSMSTTKTSVVVPLIPACGFPEVPKPSAGGITARTRLPTFLPVSAISRPGSDLPGMSDGTLPNVLCLFEEVVPSQV